MSAHRRAILPPMNRTDRLYALVEELRAVAPRPGSSRWLAGRFEVSVRTVERDLGALQQAPADVPERLPPLLEEAVLAGELVELTYTDGGGRPSTRLVEPVGIVGNERAWYLVGWCRLRDAPRSFRADRISRVRLTGERPPPRPFDLVATGLPASVRPLGLAGRNS